jgi:hypothetical protein
LEAARFRRNKDFMHRKHARLHRRKDFLRRKRAASVVTSSAPSEAFTLATDTFTLASEKELPAPGAVRRIADDQPHKHKYDNGGRALKRRIGLVTALLRSRLYRVGHVPRAADSP